MLAEVGKIIKETIRKTDFAARFGGDEFMVVMTETNEEGVKKFCERLRIQIVDRHFKKDFDEMFITPSMGYAVSSIGARDLNSTMLIRIADQALYEAKKRGRNQTFGHSQLRNPVLFEQAKRSCPQ